MQIRLSAVFRNHHLLAAHLTFLSLLPSPSSFLFFSFPYWKLFIDHVKDKIQLNILPWQVNLAFVDSLGTTNSFNFLLLQFKLLVLQISNIYFCISPVNRRFSMSVNIQSWFGIGELLKNHLLRAEETINKKKCWSQNHKPNNKTFVRK